MMDDQRQVTRQTHASNLLEMKLNFFEIIFIATFNKQSNRVLEKCNNTVFKTIKLQPNQFAL